MYIIGIVGMPGSGKTEALGVFEQKGIPTFNMGDVVTKIEPAKRGIHEINEFIEDEIRTDLRKKFGPAGIAIRTSEEVENIDSKIVAIGGIHSFPEVNYFKEKFGDDFILIAVKCEKETRFKRLEKRGIRPLTREQFEHREKHDVRDIPELMKMADYKINNEDTLDDFKKEIENIMKNIEK